MNQHQMPAFPVRDAWEPEDEVIDLRKYWNVLRRNQWRILGFAFAVTLLVTLVVFAMTPIYRSTATVLVEAQQANVVSREDAYGVNTQAKEYFLTQFEILKSRPIVERVIAELDLRKYPEYNPDLKQKKPALPWREWLPPGLLPQKTAASGNTLSSQVAAYYGNLAIEPVRATQLVDVHFESEDPELAARVANAHANAYIENSLEAKLAMTQSAVGWMGKRLEGLKSNLEASERRLQEFREREQVVDVAGLKALPAQEINELTTRLVDARRTLSLSRSNYMQVRALEDSTELESVPAVLQDTLVGQLKNQKGAAEQKVAELAKRYGPKHPTLISAQTELNAATDTLRRQVNSVVQGLRREYDIAAAEEQQIQASIGSARQEYHQTGRKEGALLERQREVDTNRQLYEMFYNRMRETSETGDLATATARVLSPAVVTDKPVKPKKRLIVMLTFVMSALLAAGIAFLLEAMDNTVRNAQDVEEKLGVPLLGMVPLLKAKPKAGGSAGHAFLGGDDPGFKEAIRTVRTGITLSALDNPHKVLIVTSTVPGEGKSTIAANLAFAFAHIDRVLLIDCDMRRPSLATEFKVARNHPGLAELIAGSAELQDCLIHRKGENIDLITAEIVPPNPLELISSRRFASLLEKLRGCYDRILIDCPPTMAVSDAAVLSTHADGSVFVIKADSTAATQISRGLENLRKVNTPLVGAVVNQLDTAKAERYRDYGYGSYIAYYGNNS